MKVIEIKNLTKKFKTGYGIFDINIEVKAGEVYGYLGPNGSGKSTTIRHIMGYLKPQAGSAHIFGKDAWLESNLIQNDLGYLPGEIAFPEYNSGIDFIKMIFNLREQTNWDYVEELINYWEFDPNVKIKKMSKGMKQKVGLVIAFMHKPKLLVLDEPTNGLDPLMQEKFISLILKEKAAGTTVLMSSHIFAEIEKTCDKVAIIKSGRIISDVEMNKLKLKSDRKYEIEFVDSKVLKEYLYKNSKTKHLYKIPYDQVDDFFEKLKKFNIKDFNEIPFSLEEYFLDFYKKEEKQGGIKNV
ncbi:ABC transporter ATP-binding protein [Williamsoniiplasma somnilux]|uniref:ABC transporter ATP-binding protein n=1 Tax=Williamsoniiplasma somnilux TaxID=215578 RepID=A0A2K8NXC2_9MOLU|nr:ABC transporter ATP-binding protein [Williamsoniiplasma somnilux]ATZ18470.1 ABC transporter ATP-binding protein [Williamsoniiplasma somnilux]